MDCYKRAKNIFDIIPVILTVILITNFFSCNSAEKKQAEFYYKLGASYMRENEIQKAFVELQKAKELDPENKEVLNLLGLIYLQFEDYENAIKSFKSAISVDKRFSEAHNHLGIAYTKISNWEYAIKEFKKALSNPLYQNPEVAFTNLGFVYYRLKKYDEAITNFNNAIRRAPDYFRAYYGLALCHNKKGDYKSAASSITEAIRFDPRYNGDRLKAIKDIEDSIYRVRPEELEDLKDYLEILKY